MTSSLSLSFSRRNFLANVGVVTAGSALPKALLGSVASSPFRVAVINDEISQDFERACQVASGFGMKWIELRGMWSKNILDLDANQIGHEPEVEDSFGDSTHRVSPFIIQTASSSRTQAPDDGEPRLYATTTSTR